MGCTSSKVEQKPLDLDEELIKDTPPTSVKSSQRSEAEEYRPPLLVESRPGNVVDLADGRSHDRCTRPVEAGENKGGETVTEESGLQIRTPRLAANRGLHFAAKIGDLTLVHTLLSNTAMLSSTDENAGAKSNLPFTGTVLSTPRADVDERGMWGNTPLLVATQYANPQVALTLIQNGADACVTNERQATPLHYSCAEGLVAVGQALLEKGADASPPAASVHHPSVDGGRTMLLTPMAAAATGGHTELVRLLLEHGAAADGGVSHLKEEATKEMGGGHPHFDGGGMSPLMGAARFGHTATCHMLVDNGARLLAEV